MLLGSRCLLIKWPLRERKRITFARVGIKMSACVSLPQTIMLEDDNGNRVEHKVEYEWLLVSRK